MSAPDQTATSGITVSTAPLSQSAPTYTQPATQPISINTATHVPIKLTPQTFLSWRAMFSSLFFGHQLLPYVEGTLPCPSSTIHSAGVIIPNTAYEFWRRQDQLILHAILASVSELVAPSIASAATSHEAWSRLHRLFVNPSRSRVMNLKHSLSQTRKDSLTVAEYMQKIRSISDELTLVGHAIAPDDLVLHALNGLSQDYAYVAATIRGRDTTIDFDELTDRLVEHEVYLAAQQSLSGSLTSAVAHLTLGPGQPPSQQHTRQIQQPPTRQRQQHNPRPGPPNKQFNRNYGARPRCQLCGKNGHDARACYQLQHFGMAAR